MEGQDAKTTEITARGIIWAVVFMGDTRHIVAGGDERTIRCWNIEDGMEVGQPMKASGSVNALAVSKDGRWIVSGDTGHKIILWNAITHEKVLESGIHTNCVVAVDISSDSTRIVSGSLDKTARIFSITSSAQLFGPLHHENTVAGVAFSPDGTRIATATVGSSVRVYDARSGSKILDIPVNVQNYLTIPLAWSADGQRLFAIEPGKFIRVDVSTSTSSRQEWLTQNSDTLASILVTTKRFVICSSGSSVSFWDSISYTQLGALITHSGITYGVAVSPDAQYLACGYGSTIAVHRLSNVLPQEYFNEYIPKIPLMHLSDLACESWSQGDLAHVESILSDEISQSKEPNQHAFANRALVRARLKRWNEAIDDAKVSLQIEASPIGHIAKARVYGGKGEHELALQAFDYVFHGRDALDNRFLLFIKAILLFVSGKQEDAVSRVEGLIAFADDNDAVYCYDQVLAYMRLTQRDYDLAVQTCEHARSLPQSQKEGHLTTVSLIFGWVFDRLEAVAWQRLCETLYASGRLKEFSETLARMVGPLADDEKEAAFGRVLEETITRSGEVTLLSWIGQSSSLNSCLPASPSVYNQTLYVSPVIEPAELERCVGELRTMFSQLDAVVVYDRVIRLPPVRFVHFRLHLPCVVFSVNRLSKKDCGVYCASTPAIGDVEFMTTDLLPTTQARRLVFVHPWFHDLPGPHTGITWPYDAESNMTDSDEDSTSKTETDSELVRMPILEEIPEDPLDSYTQALQLIARLGQPFSALLLLRQPDGSFKRVAVDHEIIVPGLGHKVPRDLRAEVLEIV